jgi:hypothetical protein
MDIVAAISNYVTKMVSSDGAAGPAGKMKILLLDSETVCPLGSGSVDWAGANGEDGMAGIDCLYSRHSEPAAGA